MGKSTVAAWLRELGVPVLDSDQVLAPSQPPQAGCFWRQSQSPQHSGHSCGLLPSSLSPVLTLAQLFHLQVVHALYQGGAAVEPVDAAFPGVASGGGELRAAVGVRLLSCLSVEGC